jgi:pyridoxine 5-phosphate synthase
VSPDAEKITIIQTSGGSQYLSRIRNFGTPDESGILAARQPEIEMNRWLPRLCDCQAAPDLAQKSARRIFMLKLGVNIDHVATLREARYRGRGFGEPDPVAAARLCEAAGAHGITAHLREDRRHIQDRDIWKLREVVQTRLNLEMANAPEIVEIALKLKPEIVCIVPERRLEVTTEGGLDVVAAEKALAETRKKLNGAGIEVSLFIAPDENQIEASARAGAQFIELHTGKFAEDFYKSEIGNSKFEIELQRLVAGAKLAHSLGLKVNAGHGLNYVNLPALFAVPHLVELNIGHSLVSRALFAGMETAVKEMLAAMQGYRR